MLSRMQQRRGSASQWTTANTVLAAGEMGFETDTNKFKIGDGLTEWNDLPYFVNTDDIESGLLDTDEISEGTLNLYFTDARAQSAVAEDISDAIDAIDTDVIEEGTTNLYFTDQRAIDAVGENLALDDLSDVATAGVADGDALVYDTATTSWVPGSVAIDSLNDIADVNITDPADGEVLVYSDGDWVNQEASGGGIKDITFTTSSRSLTLDDIGDLVKVDTVLVNGDLDPVLSAATWATQTSNFGSTNINSVAYGDNLWVAGGSSGQLRTSTDTTTWVTQTSNLSATSYSITSIIFANGIWLAGTGTNSDGEPPSPLLFSTDAVAWVTRDINMSFFSGGFGTDIGIDTHLAYGNNIFVAVGGYSPYGSVGLLKTSTDAINWVTQTSNFGNTNINSIAYGEGLWVAGGKYAQLRTSTNAINWTTRTSNFEGFGQGGAQIRSIAYANNIWLAVGEYGQIRASTDTITWVTRNSNFANGIQGDIRSIKYGNNVWVAAGRYGNVRSSTDTITWTTQTSNFGNTDIRSIAYANNLWVAGGVSGQIRTSQNVFEQITGQAQLTIPANSTVAIPVKSQINIVQAGDSTVEIVSEQEVVVLEEVGVTWTSRLSNFENTDIYSVAYGDNLWVAVGQAGELRTSTNAITWVTRTSNFAFPIFSIAYGNNLWVAGGGSSFLGSSEMRTSTNAITWVTQTSNFGATVIRSIAYGNNIWVAGGDFGQIRTSTNAINWVTQTSNFGNTAIRSVAFGNNLWVAGGNDGQLRTSTNAINWVTQTSSFGNSTIRSIDFGNNLWLAGGYGLSSSTDAITWTTNTVPLVFGSIFSINYADDLWMLGGSEGQVRTSTNGINWTNRDADTELDFNQPNSIGFGNNIWVIGANSGKMATTQEITNEIDVVTINSSSGLKTRDKWSVATAIKTGEDEWLITGDLSE